MLSIFVNTILNYFKWLWVLSLHCVFSYFCIVIRNVLRTHIMFHAWILTNFWLKWNVSIQIINITYVLYTSCKYKNKKILGYFRKKTLVDFFYSFVKRMKLFKHQIYGDLLTDVTSVIFDVVHSSDDLRIQRLNRYDPIWSYRLRWDWINWILVSFIDGWLLHGGITVSW